MTGGTPPEHPMPGPPPGWAQQQGQPLPAYSRPPYPPSGYLPTGYPPPSPPAGFPPRRRRSRWLTVGLPIGLVLLLGGCGAAITLFVTSVGTSIEPAQRAATGYAKALVDQQWSSAQAMLCRQDRMVTPDQLAAHYSASHLTGYSMEGVNVVDYDGRVSATATIRFDTADGLSNSTTLPLIKEGGTWRPCP